MIRILFVDDEPRVLQGLERQLFAYGDDWDMVFVASGAAALDELGARPFDVLVTDMRMPGMDGPTLLKLAQERFPKVIRIVLSGHSEFESALRTMPIAHQFLSKPCPPDTLRAVLERACGLRSLLEDEALRRLVGEVGDLPVRPKVFSELSRALADDSTSLEAIARIVEQDMAISSKLLHVVNTAFFAANRRIATVLEATRRLGTSLIRGLVLSSEVFRDLGGPAGKLFSIDELHRHALQVGHVARQIVEDPAERDDAFMAGLLHDLGKLLLASTRPKTLMRVAKAAGEAQCPWVRAEAELLGTTHAEVGAYLLGLWGFPYPVMDAVANHHAPERCVGPIPPTTSAASATSARVGLTQAVHLANLLVHEQDPRLADGNGDGDGDGAGHGEPLLGDPYLDALGLGPSRDLARWRAIAAKVVGEE